MKAVDKVVALVVDYGNFESLAVKLAETYSKVYYYTPCETEYRQVSNCSFGTGVPNIQKVESFLDPEVFDKVDLFVFPDIGFDGVQRTLINLGKAVWGSREATQLELDRELFLEVLAEVGLPVPECKVVKGLAALEATLKKDKDKWIKISHYRGDMETWHHIDYEHSLPMLNYLASTFGGRSEDMTFIVQTPIPDAQENGYDGFCIDGVYPSRSFQGYEKKNELYLGTWLENDELPDNIKMVNEAFAPVLKKVGYRNFFATEIRDDYFIDPTPRMAGQSQEHLLETCSNLAEVIWSGANGVLVEPRFNAKFAASATLHCKETPNGEGWKMVHIPAKSRRWFKMSHYHQDGDTYHFAPGGNTDEIGVVIGNGDTIIEAIEALKSHLSTIEGEPVHAEVEGFADILRDIHKAQEEGVRFSSQPIPKPEVAIK